MTGRHGQPDRSYNQSQRIDRDITEMLGVVKGVLADGVVTSKEGEHLHSWCEAHPDVAEDWPGSILVDRLDQIFEDGQVSEGERRHLQELLHDLVGGEAGVLLGRSRSSQLPLDEPPPHIEVPDRTFVLTGRFAFGPPRRLHRGHQAARWMGRAAGDHANGLRGHRHLR